MCVCVVCVCMYVCSLPARPKKCSRYVCGVCMCVWTLTYNIYICTHTYIHVEVLPAYFEHMKSNPDSLHIHMHIHTYIHVQILPAYFEHMKSNPDSLLSRFLALVRVKNDKARPVEKSYLLVMNNVFHTHRHLHEVSSMWACVHVCVCVYIYIYICIYIYTYSLTCW